MARQYQIGDVFLVETGVRQYQVGSVYLAEKASSTYNETASGGVVCGKTNTPSVACSKTGSGGVVCSGTATLRLIAFRTASGGVVCSGAAVPSVRSSKTASGGAVCSGLAKPSLIVIRTVSGGVVCAGIGISRTTSNPRCAGGVAISGTSISQTTNNPACSGGVVVSGTGVPSLLCIKTSSGGVVCSGSTSPYVTCFKTASGGVLVAGNGIDEVIHQQFHLGITKELQIFLAQQTAITDLTDQIYLSHLPQSFDWSTVAVHLTKTGEDHDVNLSTSSGVAHAEIEICVRGTDIAEVNRVGQTIRRKIHSYRGAVGGLTVLGISLVDFSQNPEAPTDNSNRWRLNDTYTYGVVYRNTIAGNGFNDVSYSDTFEHITTSIARYLATQPTITALTNRIYATHLPQSFNWTGSAISMVQIGGNHFENLSDSGGVCQVRLQIDCWGVTEDQVEILTEAVRMCLQQRSGQLGSNAVMNCRLEGIICLPEAPTDKSSTWRLRYSSDYIVTYKSAVAPESVSGFAFGRGFSRAFS